MVPSGTGFAAAGFGLEAARAGAWLSNFAMQVIDCKGKHVGHSLLLAWGDGDGRAAPASAPGFDWGGGGESASAQRLGLTRRQFNLAKA